MLDNTPNQSSKFITKNWIEINDDARGTYNTNSQIKFKSAMLKSSLCDYREAFEALTAGGRNNGIEIEFKNYAPFTGYISEINNTQVDNA